IAALLCLCALASLTYLINDAADIESDRRHWSKHRRPLASGAVSVRAALTTAFVGIPLVLATAWLVSPAVALCLLLYTLITLAYSFALKSIPLVDAMTVGSLFTLRLALGVAAGGLAWSAWLLTFGACFFFSLTLAKRHTELVRAGPGAALVPGRGYRADDKALTLAYGIATATASVLLIALYIVEEVFPRAAYAHPQWLWFAPPVLFAWSSRVWLLAHRGHMHDDPVVFALRDRVSWALGGVLAVAFLLALA
ncbi:MAG: UbiA family prenyltransferase, partial [Phenylobacterium sp.]